MAKLTSLAAATTNKVLVFGEPKSGKTELAGKLAEKYNLLWFDLERGHGTLTKLPDAFKERIEIVCIPDTRSYPIAIETMLKVITGAAVEICDAHGKVNCMVCKKAEAAFTRVCLKELSSDTIVVIDSLTQLANSAMNFLQKDKPDTAKPEWEEYSNQGRLMDKFLSEIQQASYNVVVITHVTETEMEDGKARLVPVGGTRSFSRNTAKYFDHVVFCEVKNKSHKFASSTTYANNVLTGSRTDVELEKDSVPSLLAIFEGKKPATAATAATGINVRSGIALSTLKGKTT